MAMTGPESLSGYFEQLYNKHAGWVFKSTRRILGNDFEADDALQKTFIKTWEALAEGRLIWNERGWLAKLSHHEAVNIIRENNRRQEKPLSETPAADDYEGLETMLDIQAALAQIPASQREVIEAYYFGGFTLREIAGTAGTPWGTIQTRARLGRERLGLLLADLYY